MPTNPLQAVITVLQALVVFAAIAVLTSKSNSKPRLVTALLLLCTIFVGIVFYNNYSSRVKDRKGAAVMEAAQSEFVMRLAQGMKNAFGASGSASQSLSSVDGKMYGEAEKSIDKAASRDPESLPLRFKQVVLRAETGREFKTQLAEIPQCPDKDGRSASAAALLDNLFVKKKLATGEMPGALALVDQLTSSGFYRDVLKLEIYKASGDSKLFESKKAEYDASSQSFMMRLIALMIYMAFSVIVGLLVIGTQIVLLPRKISDEAAVAKIRAPAAYGFAKVYGVLIGWLTLESFISPIIVAIAGNFKTGVKDATVLALLTMLIYLLSNLPALILAWFIAIRPTGTAFFEAVKLRWKTSTRSTFGLVMAGILAWYACVPLALCASLISKNLFGSEGSSNPVLTIVMEAVRSHNVLAGCLFIIAIGVLPAICEEMLFRGFLYTSLRWHFGPLMSMVISAALFSAVHMDPGAFAPLFVLGFVFAFVFERTKSLIPSMVAHCLWNSGTFILMLSLFG